MKLKSIIKEYFKNNFLKIYLIDIVSIAAITIFLIYSRWKISNYLSLVNAYAVEFTTIQSELSNNSMGAAQKLQGVVAQVSPIVDRLNMFVFIIVPAVVFLLFIFYISLDYSIIRKEKLKKIIPAFILASLPFYFAFLYLANLFLGILRESTFTDWRILTISFVFFILSYVLHASFSFLSASELKGSSIKWLKSCIVKAYPAMLVYLLHFFFFTALFGSMLNIAIRYVTGSIGSAFWSLVVALMSIIAIGVTRKLLHSVISGSQ